MIQHHNTMVSILKARIHPRAFLQLMVIALAVLSFSAPSVWAQADALDRYRTSGVIIERFDGFVELANPAGAPAEARQTVDRVNRERRAIYEKRATENGVPASEVGKIFAMEIFERAPRGTIFKQANGTTVKK